MALIRRRPALPPAGTTGTRMAVRAAPDGATLAGAARRRAVPRAG
jgi:hypothetical protein